MCLLPGAAAQQASLWLPSYFCINSTLGEAGAWTACLPVFTYWESRSVAGICCSGAAAGHHHLRQRQLRHLVCSQQAPLRLAQVGVLVSSLQQAVLLGLSSTANCCYPGALYCSNALPGKLLSTGMRLSLQASLGPTITCQPDASAVWGTPRAAAAHPPRPRSASAASTVKLRSMTSSASGWTTGSRRVATGLLVAIPLERKRGRMVVHVGAAFQSVVHEPSNWVSRHMP